MTFEAIFAGYCGIHISQLVKLTHEVFIQLASTEKSPFCQLLLQIHTDISTHYSLQVYLGQVKLIVCFRVILIFT